MPVILFDEPTWKGFREHFPDTDLSYQPVKVAEGRANAFFLKFGNDNKIEANWRKVANYIALHFQTKIRDEFGRWNTYLFILTADPLNHELKYQLENDTFSTRKIVIEEDLSHAEIINLHILNEDLNGKIGVARARPGLDYDEILWPLLKDRVLKQKRRTQAASEVFDEYYEQLKKGNNEA